MSRNYPGEGWHDTGDIAAIDKDGFISILGRAKRFAKIGGEMVSLLAVEELAMQIWPDFNHAAVNLPDERKGEKIVLITNNQDAMLDDIQSGDCGAYRPRDGIPHRSGGWHRAWWPIDGQGSERDARLFNPRLRWRNYATCGEPW